MHTRLDLSLLILTSFILGLIFAMTWDNENNSSLRVQSDLNLQVLSLNKDAFYIINSSKGQVEIEIKNVRARIKTASCNNKICVKHGWLNSFKPMAACIPNEISAQLSSVYSKQPFDAISF